jgi:murein DD-endopeptidase MepM/ murein hydrolase activator NlpD
MIKPFKGNYRLTQTFGNKLIINGVDIYAQYGLKGHNGLDYGLPLRTQIIAPHSGKILEKAYDENGYGNYIKIENDKEGSVLAHFDSFQVNVGDEISEGQPIALSGNTGNSTGPHLHWGYYKKPRDRSNGYNGFIDQLLLIEEPIIEEEPLPEPNPGYSPTHLGQTVEQNGKIYESYQNEKGKLLWKVKDSIDWKKKYDELNKKYKELQIKWDKLVKKIQELLK